MWLSRWFSLMMLLRTWPFFYDQTELFYLIVIVLYTDSNKLWLLTCNVHMHWCCDLDVKHPQRCFILNVALLSYGRTFFRLWDLMETCRSMEAYLKRALWDRYWSLLLLFLPLKIKLWISTDEMSIWPRWVGPWLDRNGLTFLWVLCMTTLWRNEIYDSAFHIWSTAIALLCIEWTLLQLLGVFYICLMTEAS